ncbi:MAG: recombinase family protein [Oscillospiraceae bacterium]|nr:recombinase family protein [Oscillospiraceae bacterium]
MFRINRRAALYARFSSANQQEQSIDGQFRVMEDYCRKNGVIIVKKYADEAKSATTDKRPQFQQMVSDSYNHEFDTVLVYKFDRFARNRFDHAIYQRILNKNGVTLYSVIENLDDSPESIMMQSVISGMNEFYSADLSRNTKRGLRETALKAKTTGGIAPLGYDIDPETGKYIINEKEAEAVNIIFSMYAKGFGYGAIIKELNRQGFLTKAGRPFVKSSLYSILTNPKYNGTYVYNRRASKSPTGTRNDHSYKDYSSLIVVEGGCPRLVDEETFNAVTKRIKENKCIGGRVSPKHEKEEYLLTGKVRCIECNHSMIGNMRFSGRNKEKYVTYRCPTHSNICSNKEINRDYLERYTIYLLENYILNRKSLSNIKKNILKYATTATQVLEKSYEEIDAEIARNAEELKNVADAVAAGLISSALIERLNKLESEKEELFEKRSKLSFLSTNPDANIDITHILSKYASLKGAIANPEFKTFIRGFIDSIVVGKYTVIFTIKTGLDVYPSLNTSITVRRQEIYEYGKKATTT